MLKRKSLLIRFHNMNEFNVDKFILKKKLMKNILNANQLKKNKEKHRMVGETNDYD